MWLLLAIYLISQAGSLKHTYHQQIISFQQCPKNCGCFCPLPKLKFRFWYCDFWLLYNYVFCSKIWRRRNYLLGVKPKIFYNWLLACWASLCLKYELCMGFVWKTMEPCMLNRDQGSKNWPQSLYLVHSLVTYPLTLKYMPWPWPPPPVPNSMLSMSILTRALLKNFYHLSGWSSRPSLIHGETEKTSKRLKTSKLCKRQRNFYM